MEIFSCEWCKICDLFEFFKISYWVLAFLNWVFVISNWIIGILDTWSFCLNAEKKPCIMASRPWNKNFLEAKMMKRLKWHFMPVLRVLLRLIVELSVTKWFRAYKRYAMRGKEHQLISGGEYSNNNKMKCFVVASAVLAATATALPAGPPPPGLATSQNFSLYFLVKSILCTQRKMNQF